MKPEIILLTGEPKSTQHIYRNTCRGGFSTTCMTVESKPDWFSGLSIGLVGNDLDTIQVAQSFAAGNQPKSIERQATQKQSR